MAPSCQSHAEAGAVSADAPTAGINDGFRPTAALGEPTAIEPERTVGSRGTGRVEQPGRGGSWVALPGAAVGPPPALSAWQPDSVSRRASVSALLDLAKGSRRPSGRHAPGLRVFLLGSKHVPVSAQRHRRRRSLPLHAGQDQHHHDPSRTTITGILH